MASTTEHEFHATAIDLLGDVLVLRYLLEVTPQALPFCYSKEVLAACRQRMLDYLEQHVAELTSLSRLLVRH